MTTFIIGLILGIFIGVFAGNKNFRNRVIKEVKKLANQTKTKEAK